MHWHRDAGFYEPVIVGFEKSVTIHRIKSVAKGPVNGCDVVPSSGGELTSQDSEAAVDGVVKESRVVAL